MSDVFFLLTGGTILAAMAVAYSKSGDALHPLMYLGPMLFYQYVLCPASLFANEAVEPHFPDMSSLDLVLTLNLLAVGMLCVGCLSGTSGARVGGSAMDPGSLSPRARKYVFQIACVLGTITLLAFLYMLYRGGGLWRIYGGAKGYLGAQSGYIGDATLLAYPAIVLLAISWQGQRLSLNRLGLVFLFASPNLIHGLLGTRRGPTFLILVTLIFSWYLVSSRRPTVRTIVVGLGLVVLAVMFLKANRSEVYIGSELDFESSALMEQLLPTQAGPGDDFIHASSSILCAAENGQYGWGRNYLIVYFVRPIPKQIWPTKYGDAKSLLFPEAERNREAGWGDLFGRERISGAAAGFIADAFAEFSWGVLVFAYLLGRFYGYLWNKARLVKGVWTLLYIEAATLSIYVPTQSVSAVFQRFLFMSIPTLLLWKYAVGPILARRSAVYRPAFVVGGVRVQGARPNGGRLPRGARIV